MQWDNDHKIIMVWLDRCGRLTMVCSLQDLGVYQCNTVWYDTIHITTIGHGFKLYSQREVPQLHCMPWKT